MLEIAKVIAALCMVAAGDKNDYNSVVHQINSVQIDCQGFLAKCYDKRPNILLCIMERKKEHDKEAEELRQRMKR